MSCPIGFSCADMMQTPGLTAEGCANRQTCNVEACNPWNYQSIEMVDSVERLLLCLRGDWEEELASCDRAIALQPNNANFWYNRGEALRSLRRYKDAIASYNKGLEIQPDNADAWYERGIIALRNLRRYDDAIASFKKVLALQPDYFPVRYNWSYALKRLGR